MIGVFDPGLWVFTICYNQNMSVDHNEVVIVHDSLANLGINVNEGDFDGWSE